MKYNVFLVMSFILFGVITSGGKTMAQDSLSKCIPDEYSREYILLVQPLKKMQKTGTPAVNFEKQVKKYFKGKYEMLSPDINVDYNSIGSNGDSDVSNQYQVKIYRYIFKEARYYDRKGRMSLRYYLHDRLTGKNYSSVRGVLKNVFAPILNGLNAEMGL